jgi:fibronectin type 3 domain-containing protein
VLLTASSPGLAGATLNLLARSPADPPDPVMGLSAAAGNAAVKLDWTVALGVDSYRIKRAARSGGPYVTLANYTAASFTDTAVTNGYAYYYMVSAVSANGEGPDSTEVSALPAAPASLSPPSGLVALRDDGQADLSWSPSAGATSYTIKRANFSGGPLTPIGASLLPSYTDAGLSNGTAYFYVVSAVAGSVESANSSEASVTPVSMSYLVGSIIGTTGSWNNSGNTREKAMDGDTGTFLDAPTGEDDWVGLDLGLGASAVVSKIRYCPRSGYADRMAGGTFQGANSSNFTAATLFSTVASAPAFALNSLLVSNSAALRFLRYLAPAGSFGNLAEVEFYTPGPRISRVTGTVFGGPGSGTNTSDKVFDGDLNTYFDSATSNGNWVALDLGTPKILTHFRYCPRRNYGNRMLNGTVQGANAADFSGSVNLGSITSAPPDATLTAQAVNNPNAFRYVRYLSPANSFGDVAELQFFSSTPTATPIPPAPTGLTAAPGDGQVGLSWSGSSGARTYNVKRAIVTGGPYATVASRVATIHMDTGLARGTHYYVVSAVNEAGESANSAEASATLTCACPGAATGLAATIVPGRLTVCWSPVASAAGYYVFRTGGNGAPDPLSGVAESGTCFVDASVQSDSTYGYVVQAVNGCGVGPRSEELVVRSLPAPALSHGRAAAGVVFSWPVWAGNYRLETATNLNSTALWQPAANPPQNSNGTYWLSVPTTNQQQFYRLREH